jgi:MoxR-like ATPase
VPGLGKTFLVQTLSKVMGLSPGRIQCTPDLMPADILGTHIVNENDEGRRVMHFEKGPVFANLILVDEINRATPKTQAALLEVMQEGAVTSGGDTMVLAAGRFSSWRRKTPWKWKEPIRFPKRRLTVFFSNCAFHFRTKRP